MTNFKAISRSVVKNTIGISFKYIPQLRRAIKQGLTVFMFHEVSDCPSKFSDEYGLSVSRELFHRQVSWIQSNFDVIHPMDVLNLTPLPERSAVISFDDGFLSCFENGLPILEKLGLPSIVFLNMQAILEKKPILSAIACYLIRYVPEFYEFSKSVGLLPPFHLTLSPKILTFFNEQSFWPAIDTDAVLDYQGQFADLRTVMAWNNKDVVVYGNHLFDHWNASALSIDEFEEQYKKNEIALSQLTNSVNLFAFTNGQPGTCFTEREVDLLKHLGAGKVFSGACVVNRDPTKFLLGRISLSEFDKNEEHLWFRVGRAVYNDLLNTKTL
jgi:peptidoglycan/xylan/chitin deacetylase (PgdA/CDA1 family)